MDPKTFMGTLCGAMLLVTSACMHKPGTLGPAILSGFRPPEGEMGQPKGFPPLYEWMLAPDLVAAHWLGAKVNGKELVEPLNVVFVDRRSKSMEEARVVLSEALSVAGFPSRTGHSGGYYAFMDGRLHPQLPSEPNHAFSDEPFELPNDHGRVFGPVSLEGRFVFVAAFSREGVAPLDKVKHRYVSFNRARDKVADRLDERTAYKRRGFVDLRNHLAGDPIHTTGDHDGQAVLLERL